METKKLTCRVLMIGDWVNIYHFTNDEQQIKDLFPAKVVSIFQGSEVENYDTVECVYSSNISSRPADTCLPIPLTAEVLEKNGFIKYLWDIYRLPKTDFSIEHTGGLFILRISNERLCEVKSVSHLQHLLRDFNVDKEIVL